MNNDCLVQDVVDSLCLNLTFVTFLRRFVIRKQ